MKASGSYPSARALASDIRSTAAAPSVRGEELPAVTVPYFRSKTGGSLASASSDVSRRMRLSWVTAGSYFGGTITAQISGASRPSSVAAAALRWLRKAIWSCSSREMPFSFAIFSADWPMVRPVDGSAIAGTSGVQVARADLGEGGQPLAQAARARGLHEDLRHAAAVQDGDVGEALRASADPHFRVSLQDRAGHLRDGLVGGGARAVHGMGRNPRRHRRPQHDLAREVGRAHGRDHLAHDDGVHPGRLHFRPLQQLADADAGEVHRGKVAVDGGGLGERGSAAGDDGHACAVRGGSGHVG